MWTRTVSSESRTRHWLYDGRSFEVRHGLLAELWLDVVRAEPLYHRYVSRVMFVRLSTHTIMVSVYAYTVQIKKKDRIVLREIHLRTTGCHLSNGITKCYLQPDRGGRPALTPTGQVGTRFIDPARMKGWVGLDRSKTKCQQLCSGNIKAMCVCLDLRTLSNISAQFALN